MKKLYLVLTLSKNGKGWIISGLYQTPPTTETIGHTNWRVQELWTDL